MPSRAVPGSTTLTALLHDAMILAAAKGYDVFNALDLQDFGRMRQSRARCGRSGWCCATLSSVQPVARDCC
eukprot:360117-Chlamydomonas_euryale.AAC.15